MAGKKRCAFVPAPDVTDVNAENPPPQSERCKERAVAFAGDCQKCNTSFCSKHRLPERHNCPSREECKTQALKELKEKLISESAIPNKIGVV